MSICLDGVNIMSYYKNNMKKVGECCQKEEYAMRVNKKYQGIY